MAPDDLSVDVVIDNYNYARFLTDAIESALSQTHPRVHVIAVDDGSTDTSRDVLRAFGDRIEVVLKENGGQASALNAGFARCGGDIVIPLDADDVLLPNAVALAAAAFAADPRTVKVQYRMRVIDASGRPTGAVKPAAHLSLPQGDVGRAELVFPFDLVWLRNGANAFRADALRRILPIPEREFAECADWYLAHLMPLLGPVVSVEDIAACYRVHGANRYEPQQPALDLAHVRQTIAYAAVTTRALERFRDELGLERPYDSILSVADLSNRLISLRLEPELHPKASDRRWRLVTDGARAAARRFEVAWPMKLAFCAWFACMATVPRPFATRVAELLLFPERRRRLSRVLQRFQK